MEKGEFKERVKRLGCRLHDVAEDLGLSEGTVYNWKEVPKDGEYWLLYRESEARLASLRITFAQFVGRFKEDL